MRSAILNSVALVGVLSSFATAHEADQAYGQVPIVSGPTEVANAFDRPILERDGYVPSFSGISTFAHLPYVNCWEEGIVEDFDFAVVGT